MHAHVCPCSPTCTCMHMPVRVLSGDLILGGKRGVGPVIRESIDLSEHMELYLCNTNFSGGGGGTYPGPPLR